MDDRRRIVAMAPATATANKTANSRRSGELERGRYGDDPVAAARMRWEHPQMASSVLVVDDHPSYRSIARRVLVAGGFTVVGEASGGIEAIRASGDLRPDLVLLDVQLPDMDGFGVAMSLARQVDPPAVVLVSSRSRADYGSRIEECGACGFIAKSNLSGEAVRRLLPTSGLGA
jgi:CheY-like chemotaxis protein